MELRGLAVCDHTPGELPLAEAALRLHLDFGLPGPFPGRLLVLPVCVRWARQAGPAHRFYIADR